MTGADKLTLVGIFKYASGVVSAIEGLRAQEVPIEAVYSPMRAEEIREALGEPPLGLGRFFTLTGGIAGILTGIFLTWYTAAQWRFIVGGKPPIPLVPAVIPAFEFFILLAVFFTLGGLLLLNRMPRMRLPAHYDRRFSQDRFGIVIHCGPADVERVSGILMNTGAEEVRQVEQ